MTISRKTLSIFVALGGWADVVLTLIGQIGCTDIREDDPVSRAILLVGPWALLAAGLLFHALIGLLVYKAPAWIAIPLALVMLASHMVAIAFWAAILGAPLEAISTGIYFLCIGAAVLYAILRLCNRGKAAS